jgi:hypothetical protein
LWNTRAPNEYIPSVKGTLSLLTEIQGVSQISILAVC